MSPIPLGIFATAGAGAGAPAGSYELIGTTILGSNTGSVTFSSIPSTYKHLQLRMSLRSAHFNAITTVGLRFNGSTGSYASHKFFGTSYNDAAQSQDSYVRFVVPGNVTNDVYSGHVMDVLDYTNASNKKTTRMLGGWWTSAGSSEIGLYSSAWFTQSAVTSITVVDVSSSGQFMINSRFSLYGIKG